ncbi:MAG: hypothetical protein ACUZ8N_15085 [Candidatus Scalindua sp.]
MNETGVYTKTDLVFGFLKKQILVAVISGLKNAEDFPWTEKRPCPSGRRGGLSPDKRRRGLYSGKIVFGFFPKTIL